MSNQNWHGKDEGKFLRTANNTVGCFQMLLALLAILFLIGLVIGPFMK